MIGAGRGTRRKSGRRAVLASRLVAIPAALAVAASAGTAWWLVRDDRGAAESVSGASDRDTSVGNQVFRQSGVPFTFEHPGDFAAGAAPSGILWVVGISPVDIIDVRRVADREFTVRGMVEVYGTTLRRQTGVDVLGQETRTSEAGGLVIFDVVTGSPEPLRSRLVYLAGDGSTWQLECQWRSENEAAINAACDLMMRTLAPL